MFRAISGANIVFKSCGIKFMRVVSCLTEITFPFSPLFVEKVTGDNMRSKLYTGDEKW